MVSLSLSLYKAQRVLLFSEHLHLLMLIDVTFHNNAAAPGLFFRMAIKDLSYLFGQLKQRGFFFFFLSKPELIKLRISSDEQINHAQSAATQGK